MRRFLLARQSFFVLPLLCGLALTSAACMNSGSSGGTGGSGGTSSGATGGTGTGSGGSGGGNSTGGSGSGGGGSGGGGATGGKTGTGGNPATGGSNGTGGSATGGNTGSGGAGATAGSGAGGSATGGAGGSATGGAGGGATVGTGCTPAALTTTGVLDGRYGSMLFDNNYYFMQVNEWNSSASQVMTYGGDFLFQMTTQMGSTAVNGSPTGFPSIFIGANSKHTTTGSNLPKAVSALTTVPTTWVWNDNGTLADDTTNSYDATYDVWFSTSSAGEPNASGPTGGYLMVWYHKPADAQPIGGAPMEKAITIAGVPGTWDVWIGLNGTRPCISYVSTQTILSLSYDLNLFIQDAVKNQPNTIQSTWYLTNIFTGFEIWRGGLDVQSTSFCALVN
jgi:Glycosyl hydrolase family 12